MNITCIVTWFYTVQYSTYVFTHSKYVGEDDFRNSLKYQNFYWFCHT